MIDFSRSTFLFKSLPIEVQVLVMKQMTFNSLIKFRFACQHFFNLTENYKVSNYCPLEEGLSYGRWITYRSHEKKFQCHFYDPERYVDVPTSKFWNHEQLSCRLTVFKMTEDNINFMEKLKKIYIKFNPIKLMDVKMPIMAELFQHISYVKKIFLSHPVFMSNEFLCSGLLKHIKGKIHISVYVSELNEPTWLPLLRRRNVEGINFVIKQLADGTCNFEELTLCPLRSDIMLDDVMKDIDYVSIFNPDCHLATPLCRIPLEQLRQTDKSLVNYVVAIKKRTSGECYLITIRSKRMGIVKCAQDELISRTLEHELDGTILDENFVDLVYKQKVFDRK